LTVDKKTIDSQQDNFMREVLDDVKHNPGAEIVRYARRRKDILSLGMGESDVGTPDFISQAVEKALADGHTNYGPVLGRPELRQAIAKYHEDIYDVSLSEERIIVTSSGTSAIHLALTSVIDKGDEVVTVFPLWKNLLGALKLQQAIVKGVDLKVVPGGWKLDLDELFSAVSPNTRAIVINTPNNPTGWIMNEDEIRAVMEFARQRGIWVISDEVYGRMTYGKVRAPSFLDVSREDDRLFIVNSFSKNWSMTGWRLGWLIGPKEAESRIYDLVLYDNMGPPNFMQFGGIAALEGGENFIKEQKGLFQKNMDIVWDAFSGIGKIDAIKPESGFYAFFRVDGEEDCMKVTRQLIDDVALGLAPGCAFGRNFAGYIRMCFAVSDAKLSDALGRLREAMKG
jgi:aspartate/methionine/tyrosine aminotransferase